MIKSYAKIKISHPKLRKYIESGTRFNRLVVIEYLKNKPHIRGGYYLCKCDCGKTKITHGAYLKNNHVTRCGALCGIDLPKIKSGTRFGRLQIIAISKNNIANCICDCGNYKNISVLDLYRGHVASCGCLHIHSLKMPPKKRALFYKAEIASGFITDKKLRQRYYKFGVHKRDFTNTTYSTLRSIEKLKQLLKGD